MKDYLAHTGRIALLIGGVVLIAACVGKTGFWNVVGVGAGGALLSNYTRVMRAS